MSKTHLIRGVVAAILLAFTGSAVAQDPPQFMRGAKPTPQHVLLAAPKFQPSASFAAPTSIFYVPEKLSVWGNNRYGNCVTAEEAGAKACYVPEIFIDESTVVAWGARHGVNNGADLEQVLRYMQSDGFKVSDQQYNDGHYSTVNYRDQTELRAALVQGPVKIAIDANALPGGAGQGNGWHSFSHARHGNTDHCVGIFGYGTAAECFAALKVPLPAGVDPAKADCYLLFTWGSIGVVDHGWLLGTCTEAWVRNPTTVGVPPLPAPIPPTPPTPPTPPPGPPTPCPHFMGVHVGWWMLVLGFIAGRAVVFIVMRPKATPTSATP